MDEKSFETYTKLIQKHGAQAQIKQAIEEMAELMVAMSHWPRGKCSLIDIHHEVAAVHNMMEQLCVVYGINNLDSLKEEELVKARLTL